MFSQFVRFCLIGALGVFIDFALTYLLKEKAKWHAYIANACGFILAASSNYVLNRVWTFQSQNNAIGHEYLSFILIALVGLIFNTLILYLFTERIPLPFIPAKGKLRFYVAKGIAIGLVTIWNFFMNYFITFQ
jgi:Predicted membrane protein